MIRVVMTQALLILQEFLLIPFEGALTGYRSIDAFDILLLSFIGYVALAGVVCIIRRFFSCSSF